MTKKKAEEEQDMESEEDEVVKKVLKVKKEKGAKTKNQQKCMELRLQKGSIKETRKKVHEMLGVPMGNIKLEDLEERPSKDPFIKDWEDQYCHLEKPTPPEISFEISNTSEADFMFKINFLTLFASTMGTLENGGRVPTTVRKRIS
ncbi:hypothetical protein Tco_0701181 [Tanacetum coccineum]